MPIDEDIQPPQFRELLANMTKLEGKRPHLEEVRVSLLHIVDIETKKGQVAIFLFPRWGLSTVFRKVWSM